MMFSLYKFMFLLHVCVSKCVDMCVHVGLKQVVHIVYVFTLHEQLPTWRPRCCRFWCMCGVLGVAGFAAFVVSSCSVLSVFFASVVSSVLLVFCCVCGVLDVAGFTASVVSPDCLLRCLRFRLTLMLMEVLPWSLGTGLGAHLSRV